MRTQTLIALFATMILLVCSTSCKDDNEPPEAKNTELQKLILGEWVMIKAGYDDNIRDIDAGQRYEEFRSDWLLDYYSETEKYQTNTYRIDETHIHLYTTDGKLIFRLEYSIENNTLSQRITYGNIAKDNVFVYKRREQ